MSSIHRTAEQGFTAGAATYVSGRPDYPAAVVGWLGEELGLGDGKTALDLGAGTGKFLPFLLATGAKVLAVEPVAAMREQLVRGQPDVRVLSGAAEAIPCPTPRSTRSPAPRPSTGSPAGPRLPRSAGC